MEPFSQSINQSVFIYIRQPKPIVARRNTLLSSKPLQSAEISKKKKKKKKNKNKKNLQGIIGRFRYVLWLRIGMVCFPTRHLASRPELSLVFRVLFLVYFPIILYLVKWLKTS